MDKIKELRKKSMALPKLPGVYIMRDKDRNIIYIGKAKALKNRVSQYFGSQNNHMEKVRRMVKSVDDFDYIITDSEFEALILECSLIKQNTPKYNILLKDDKGYSYIKVTGDKWKKISYSLQQDDSNATYIGPYKSSYYVKSAVEEANRIFMLPTCNRQFPRDIRKARPCLNYHIKQCCAPCTGRVSLGDYNERVESALKFLKGGSTTAVAEMTQEMNEAAERLDFEKAAKIRDRISAVKKMNDKQKVVDIKVDEQDVIAYITDGDKGTFEVFRFKDGKLFDREHFMVDNDNDSTEMMAEFITRYYTIRDDVPKQITLDREVLDFELLERWLSEKRGARVYIVVPQRGDQKQLVDMCRKNATERLAQTKGSTTGEYSVLEELRDALGLEKIPEYIEAYDNSNLSGTENVCGMVVCENGKMNKSAYKKFKIKGFDGQDDYASMAEVIDRRLTEYENAEEGVGFGRKPDLILLDGGKGQVNAVLPVMEKHNSDIPVFGMVKDDRHRTRAIVSGDGEIAISRKRKLFTFISKLQDEVHRFAIGYQRQRRNMNTFKSSLTDIPTVGTERAKALLKHFRTIKNISQADYDELLNAPKMNKTSADEVYRYFHKNEDE
ncbi:MAG: excinuclease ABC subunit UvrC [Oscillospiraceae bacterium]|nr:excinuclease ABC subunit UvrC [Oscillospiraceae bacterium]